MMQIKSTPDRYGIVATSFHWITAILIVALVALGLNADNATSDELKRALLVPHIALGVTVLLLTLARIVWWLIFDRRPPPAAGVPPILARLGRASHYLIYGFIIALVATGMATNVTGGVIEALGSGTPIPPLEHLPSRRAHGLLAWTFIALLTIHIAAAIYHHAIRRDRTLVRMVGKSG